MKEIQFLGSRMSLERGKVSILPGNPFRKLSRLQAHFCWISVAVFLVVAYNLYFVCQIKQRELEERESEVFRLQGEISLAEFHNAQLRAQVAHLSTDAGAEEVVREKLGLVKPGEVSFVVLGASDQDAQEARPEVKVERPKRGLVMGFMHWFFLGTT